MPLWEQSWSGPGLQLFLPVGATWPWRNVSRKVTRASVAPAPKWGGGFPGIQTPCPPPPGQPLGCLSGTSDTGPDLPGRTGPPAALPKSHLQGWAENWEEAGASLGTQVWAAGAGHSLPQRLFPWSPGHQAHPHEPAPTSPNILTPAESPTSLGPSALICKMRVTEADKPYTQGCSEAAASWVTAWALEPGCQG